MQDYYTTKVSDAINVPCRIHEIPVESLFFFLGRFIKNLVWLAEQTLNGHLRSVNEIIILGGV